MWWWWIVEIGDAQLLFYTGFAVAMYTYVVFLQMFIFLSVLPILEFQVTFGIPLNFDKPTLLRLINQSPSLLSSSFGLAF